MRVVLLKSVEKLGEAGEIKEVADGYARNYLIARSLAVSATPSAVQRCRELQAHRAYDRERTRDQKARTVRSLAGRRLTVRAAANERGTLFGAVTADKLSAILKSAGFAVPPEAIVLREPIKRVGEHRILLQFGSAGQAFITIVIAQK